MMQLDTSAFSAPSNGAASSYTPSQSPSKNPCKVRVRAGNYRNEPYGARVLPPISNAPKLPPAPSSTSSSAAATTTSVINDIEPTPRPRPNNRRTSSGFASRIHDNVARAADFSTHVSGEGLPVVPTAPAHHHNHHHQAHGYHYQQPQPPVSGSATSRRATPAATPEPEHHQSHHPDQQQQSSPAYNSHHQEHSPLSEMANSVNGLSDESVISNVTASSPANTTAGDATEADALMYAFVRFKYESCCYKSGFHINVGDRVVVEGDRGVNMGMVERVMTEKPKYPVPCSIARFASDDEMRLAGEYRLRELEATHLASELVVYYRLPIRIIDTEFQFDGQKLTVFFDSSSFVDFRRLQRALFREYNCRIWLVNWKEIRRNL